MTQPNRDLLDQLELLKNGWKVPERPKNFRYETGKSFGAESQKRRMYLARLKSYLPSLVSQGLLTPEEAQNQYAIERMALLQVGANSRGQYFKYSLNDAAPQMPYIDTLLGDEKNPVTEIDWRKMQQKFTQSAESDERQKLTSQARSEQTQKDYLPFLNAQVSSGQITPDEKNAVLGEIDRQIKLGVSPNDLPFADTIDQYQKNYEQTLKLIGKQNEAGQEQELNTRMQQFNEANPNNGRFAGYFAKQQAEAERAQNEIDFENFRRQKVGNLSPYSDWIERWQLEHAPNPFTVSRASSLAQGIGQLQSRLENLNQAKAEGRSTFGYGDAPFVQFDVNQFDPNQISSEIQALQEEMNNLPAETQPQVLPNTPDWLVQFAPSLKAGQQIGKSDIVTPSGQAWNKLLPSQRAMLSSFSDWMGKPLNDVTFNMENMLTRTPGAGRGWRPMRQGG